MQTLYPDGQNSEIKARWEEMGDDMINQPKVKVVLFQFSMVAVGNKRLWKKGALGCWDQPENFCGNKLCFQLYTFFQVYSRVYSCPILHEQPGTVEKTSLLAGLGFERSNVILDQDHS